MTSGKVLLVDDDANLLAAFKRQYRHRFDMAVAAGGEEALSRLSAEGPFAVIVCDMNMPGMNGLETLAEVHRRSPNTVRIMLTGNADQKTAVEAINDGAIFRFYTKPCPVESLTAGIEAAQEQYRLVMAEKELLEKTLAGSVQALMDVLSAVDPQAFGRALWLRDAMLHVIDRMDPGANRWEAEIAAMLSQIGWVCVPSPIVEKIRTGEVLSSAEAEIVLKMPDAAADLIKNIPRLEDVAAIVRHQNKGYDGSGYPEDKLAGDALPLPSRILKVLLDGLDTASSSHVYPNERDFAKMSRHPHLYDPRVLSIVRTWIEDQASSGADLSDETREVPVSLLLPGQLLLSDIHFKDGGLILAKGYILTESQILKVNNLGKIREIQEPVRVLVRRSSIKNVQKSATVAD